MELVYLWVEKYKNIEKQGFNFSPKFTCDYDGETLSIKDNVNEKGNKQYIDNFFGENINVTAIVGKNGSGKSSVLETLLEIISSKYGIQKNYIFCFLYQDTLYSFSNIDLEYNYTLDIKFKKIDQVYENYLLEDYEDTRALYIDNQTNTSNLHIWDQIDVIPTKYSQEQIDIIASNSNHNQIQAILIKNAQKYKDTLLIKEMKKFFVPTDLEIKYIDISKNTLDLLKKEKQDEVKQAQNDFKKNLEQSNYQNALTKLKKMSKLLTDTESKQNTNILDIVSFNSKYNYDNTLESKYQNILDDLDISITPSDNLFYSFSIKNIRNKEIEFINALPKGFFNFNLKNDTKNFKELSYGEKQLLILFNNILYYSSTLSYNKYVPATVNGDGTDERDEEIEVNNILLFLDELEIGMHPNWQKKSINYLINLLKLIPNKNFHIILTTHSPFILSDLPKENVIFLDTYDEEKSAKKYPNLNTKNLKNGNCINVSNHIDINPFGTNIHTLLSDGFFMEDGLMGEFAKNKIEDIIKNLNKKSYKPSKKEKTKVLLIIKSIGEPFLKQKLLDMFFKKFDDNELKKSRKIELEAEQKRIVDELKKYD